MGPWGYVQRKNSSGFQEEGGGGVQITGTQC